MATMKLAAAVRRIFWNTSRKVWAQEAQSDKEYTIPVMHGKEIWYAVVVTVPMPRKDKKGAIMHDKETGEVLVSYVPTGVRLELIQGFGGRTIKSRNGTEYVIPGDTMFAMKRTGMLSKSPAWVWVPDIVAPTCKPNTLNKKDESVPLTSAPAWVQKAVADAWERYEQYREEQRAAAA